MVRTYNTNVLVSSVFQVLLNVCSCVLVCARLCSFQGQSESYTTHYICTSVRITVFLVKKNEEKRGDE